MEEEELDDVDDDKIMQKKMTKNLQLKERNISIRS